ncbi:MAG TPA: hypothetical protein VHB20_09070 [Verrucomicrobiae bacterium]|jgi:hypothetical protein|nr:hypothetical protein [Verrucomicrobiae bacterium]
MKNIQSKIALLAVLAGSVTAQAQVQVVFTGSTAFRSVDEDRAAALFDAGFTTAGDGSANNYRTYNGTITSLFGSQTVTIYMSFSGSGSGMEAVLNGTQVQCYPVGGSSPSLSLTPDCAFSDIFPEGDNLASAAFDDVSTLGVIPFVFAASASSQLAGITNLTRDQAVLLMTDSGSTPAYFFGGSNTNINNKVYLVGRDSGSGTRITTFDDIGFFGTPNQWVNIGGVIQADPTGGQSSGSGVRNTLATNTSFIGYLGVADYNTVAATVNKLAYNGTPFNITNVENGSYGIWGYEHFVSRFGLSSGQKNLRAALITAITDSGYQSTNANYAGLFAPLSGMHVQRFSDGGPITSIDF